MKTSNVALLGLVTAMLFAVGCATVPQDQGELCTNCGEVMDVSESDTTFESLTNEGIQTIDQNTASALASFNSLSTSGVPSQSSLTSGPGMQLRRAEKIYDVTVRMSTGSTRVVRLPRSMAGRWQVGDKVKVMGNSLIRR